jgi:small lipoprotein (TIGR04454 family)
MATFARFHSSALLVPFVVLAALAAGCSKRADSGPPCDKVVDHLLEVTKQSLVGHEAMAADLKKQMVQQCVDRNYSQQTRECLMAAKDTAALTICNRERMGSAAPQAGSAIPAP